jgi:nitrite reductase (NADH) large subunit
MKKWRCRICGYIHEGDTPPDYCPICGAKSDEFDAQDEGKKNKSEENLRRIIIIGNGVAGIEAARTIREYNKKVEILIFSEEPYHFYSRIHLSTLLAENSRLGSIQIYDSSWYQEQQIIVYLNNALKSIFPLENKIQDTQGKLYRYDKLIIATGALPFVPPITGINLAGIFTLRNFDQAQQIYTYAKQSQTAIVLGGGILGIEVASSLNKLGLEVSIVEKSDHLMPQQLDIQGGNILKSILESRGIRCYLSVTIKKFTGNHKLHTVHLSNGEIIQTDLAILTAGISPNVKTAQDAKIELNKGILVNEYLQTNFKHIYAAGDVAEFQETIAGIWPAAVDQGIIAAKNALGLKVSYQGSTPLHILKVAGIELTTIGQKYKNKSTDKEIIHFDNQDRKYVKLIHNGKILLGAVVLDVSGIGFHLENLIKNKSSIVGKIFYLERGDWSILKKKE